MAAAYRFRRVGHRACNRPGLKQVRDATSKWSRKLYIVRRSRVAVCDGEKAGLNETCRPVTFSAHVHASGDTSHFASMQMAVVVHL
jgi:hypothetical protein